MSLLITGTIGIDSVQTPTDSVERVPGGSAAYASVGAAMHHQPVHLVAAVGHDWPADHRQALEAIDGLCLNGVEVRSEATTFAWGGRYEQDWDVRTTLFTNLGVLELGPPAVTGAAAACTSVFLGNAHPAEQAALLAQVPDRTIAVANTMNLWIDVARDDLMALLSQIDGLILNDEEATMLGGADDPADAAAAIAAMGPRFVVVTLGGRGCVLVDADGATALPAMAVEEVVDPTGAGDSFCGSFMGYLATAGNCQRQTMEQALRIGSVTASFTLGSFGLDGLLGATPAAIAARMDALEK